MEEEKEITMEDLLTPNISNQVVEEEEKEDEEVLLNIPSMDNFFDKNTEKKPVSELDQSVIVRDNPALLNPVQINTKVGEIAEVVDYNATEDAIVYEPSNPKESDFYIQTQEIVNKIDDIVENPVKLSQSTINVGEAKQVNVDFEQSQEIDVLATTEKINSEINNSPTIIKINPVATQNIIRTDENSTGIPPMFVVSEDEKEDTSKYYSVSDSAYKYIKDSILTEGELETYNTWEEFVAKAREVTEKIAMQDPVVKKILAEANFNLQNESYRKYIDMLNVAINENGLDSPEELSLIHI